MCKYFSGQHNQSWIIDDLLGGRSNGYFLEAGAWDGTYLSNSLFFEVERNWTGLLVEVKNPNVVGRPAKNASVELIPG